MQGRHHVEAQRLKLIAGCWLLYVLFTRLEVTRYTIIHCQVVYKMSIEKIINTIYILIRIKEEIYSITIRLAALFNDTNEKFCETWRKIIYSKKINLYRNLLFICMLLIYVKISLTIDKRKHFVITKSAILRQNNTNCPNIGRCNYVFIKRKIFRESPTESRGT